MSLVESCKEGGLEGVGGALQSGVDVNTNDESGKTGLMWAVKNKHNSVVELLIKTPNIDVNQKDGFGRSALHWAMVENNCEALKLLLDVPGIDLTIVGRDGWSAVYRAVFWENNEALELLLNVPKVDVNILDNDDGSAVHWAVDTDNIGALKLLLDHPGLTTRTLNHKIKRHATPMAYLWPTYGVTPVMMAMAMEKLEHIALLANDPRVDLDTTDERGKSLEERARYAGYSLLGGLY